MRRFSAWDPLKHTVIFLPGLKSKMILVTINCMNNATYLKE
jgi:hypothetical protein